MWLVPRCNIEIVGDGIVVPIYSLEVQLVLLDKVSELTFHELMMGLIFAPRVGPPDEI